MKTISLIASVILFFLFLGYVQARPAPSEESLKATFYKMRDEIRKSCNRDYPTDDNGFQQCIAVRDKAMVWFFTTLWKYRDSEGINSIGFTKGIDCVEKHAPAVNEPDRKLALKLVNWVDLKNCYESSLSE